MGDVAGRDRHHLSAGVDLQSAQLVDDSRNADDFSIAGQRGPDPATQRQAVALVSGDQRRIGTAGSAPGIDTAGQFAKYAAR